MYTVRTIDGDADYYEQKDASLVYMKVITKRVEAKLLGPVRLDGSRELIARYKPRDLPEPGDKPGQRRSEAAFAYAMGATDAMDGLAWWTEREAHLFAEEHPYLVDVESIAAYWRVFLAENKPR